MKSHRFLLLSLIVCCLIQIQSLEIIEYRDESCGRYNEKSECVSCQPGFYLKDSVCMPCPGKGKVCSMIDGEVKIFECWGNQILYQSKSTNSIGCVERPRLVFGFWQGNKYRLIKILLNLAFLHQNSGKGYHFHFLDHSNLLNYGLELHHVFYDLKLNHQADYLRSQLVYLYGGMWIDADTIILDRIDSIFDHLDERRGVYVLENSYKLFSGIFAAHQYFEFNRFWRDGQSEVLDKKGSKLDWLDLANDLMTQIYETQPGIQREMHLLQGQEALQTIYYAFMNDVLFREDKSDFESYIRRNQTMVEIFNSVYKFVDQISEEEFLANQDLLNTYLNYSISRLPYKQRLTIKDLLEMDFSQTVSSVQAVSREDSLRPAKELQATALKSQNSFLDYDVTLFHDDSSQILYLVICWKNVKFHLFDFYEINQRIEVRMLEYILQVRVIGYIRDTENSGVIAEIDYRRYHDLKLENNHLQVWLRLQKLHAQESAIFLEDQLDLDLLIKEKSSDFDSRFDLKSNAFQNLTHTLIDFETSTIRTELVSLFMIKALRDVHLQDFQPALVLTEGIRNYRVQSQKKEELEQQKLKISQKNFLDFVEGVRVHQFKGQSEKYNQALRQKKFEVPQVGQGFFTWLMIFSALAVLFVVLGIVLNKRMDLVEKIKRIRLKTSEITDHEGI